MAFKAFMFIYRSVSFFNYIIDPNFELNIDLVSGFLSAIDSLASGIYGSNIQSISLGNNSIFTLDVSLTSKTEDQFKIISFVDKALPDSKITEYLQKIRDQFLKSYSPQEILDWDGNVLKYIGFRKTINQILDIIVEDDELLERPIETNPQIQRQFEEGLLFLLCNTQFRPLVQHTSHPNEIFTEKILDNLTYEMQKSNKDIINLVLPLLDRHQIAYIRCQKNTNDVYLMQYHEKNALYGIMCYLIDEKYQGFLPKIITLAQTWTTDQLKQMWSLFFDMDKFVKENLNLAQTHFSIVQNLKFDPRTVFQPKLIAEIKNNDHLINALLTNEPIAIIGEPGLCKEMLNQLLFFTQHREMRIVEYPPIEVPKESADIVIIPSKESKHYKDFVQLETDKKVVKGGESNKFCMNLVNILSVIPNSALATQALHKKMNWLMSKATLIRNLSWGSHITNHEIATIRGDIDADTEKIVLKLAGGYNSQLQDLLDRLVTQVPMKSLILDENFVKFNDHKILISGKLSPDKRVIYYEFIKKMGTMLLGPKVLNSFLV